MLQNNNYSNSNSILKNHVKEQDFQELDLINTNTEENSFLSNFGKQFQAGNARKGGSPLEIDPLKPNQQKFVILRKSNNDF